MQVSLCWQMFIFAVRQSSCLYMEQSRSEVTVYSYIYAFIFSPWVSSTKGIAETESVDIPSRLQHGFPFSTPHTSAEAATRAPFMRQGEEKSRR